MNESIKKQPEAPFGSFRWLKAPKASEIKSAKGINIVDLFCGCGGFSLGIVEAAISKGIRPNICLAVDNDSDAIGVYKKNLQNYSKKIMCCDITSLFVGQLGMPVKPQETKFIQEIDPIDFLLAGPPCQGHSDLNNITRRSDPRNDLYLTAIRAVELLKPKIAIIENVAAVVHDKSQIVSRSISLLKRLGYTIETVVIDSAKLCVAQKRKRHLLVAYKIKLPFTICEYLIKQTYSELSLSDVIKDIVDEDQSKADVYTTPPNTSKLNLSRISYLFEHDFYNLPNNLRPDCHKNKKHSYISMYGRLQWDLPAQTITSGFGSMGQGRYVHPLRKRMITPHEAARIQGFPDYFDFSCIKKRTSLQCMIANAVPPPVSALITEAFINNIK